MIQLDKVIVVEGKYDKIKLESLIDSTIITTNGFSIFKDKEQQELLRMLAKSKGLLVLTDSDAAGFKIRAFLRNICGKENVTDAYIPDFFGKEKRKTAPSKEGKLGVEGIDANILREILTNAGAGCTTTEKRRKITKTDLFEAGLSGTASSSEKRRKLQKQLNLPERLSANGLLTVLNTIMTYEEYEKLVNTQLTDK
ncbi:MAG: DUF4093 domain-containing protein [Oscillospiraceae bacterium]|nr:DUF4093 domain-containing protein [Oscillospiraceae bacterium]